MPGSTVPIKTAEFINLRKIRGFTQRSLAAASGVDRTKIQRLEKGDHAALDAVIVPLARALDVHPTEIINQTLSPIHLPETKIKGTIQFTGRLAAPSPDIVGLPDHITELLHSHGITISYLSTSLVACAETDPVLSLMNCLTDSGQYRWLLFLSDKERLTEMESLLQQDDISFPLSDYGLLLRRGHGKLKDCPRVPRESWFPSVEQLFENPKFWQRIISEYIEPYVVEHLKLETQD